MTVEAHLDAARKKQLGQYFTDQRVGRLLAALADAGSAESIIDPMVGSADLLQACLSVGARPERMVGIELDPIALLRARSALHGVGGTDLILGDAFSAPLPSTQFDLVITNPPYIRYQSRGKVDGISVPTSAGVRAGLIQAITTRPGFSDEDRALWLRAAKEYPGTSDIAVPAWILSAALVREGGVLAVVAPQVWLSRKYAQAVRTLLDAAFNVEVIVEDGDASWFDDAQVRTQLVVARRRPLTASRAGRKTVMARATRGLVANGELRGTLGSEQAVAKALHAVTSSSPVTVTTGLAAHVERGLSVSASGQGAQLPPRVASALGATPGGVPVRTLNSYGWRAGQGLRSGANDFFYVRLVDGVVRPAARWGIDSLAIPTECLLPAVRRQNELGDEFAVDEALLPSRVVDLRGWVTPSDLKRMGPSDAQVLPASVGKWIAQVASTPLSPKDPTKLFPDLSAVATNSRTDRSGQQVRFWYQLPALAPRHRPTLFVGRVCGGRPKTVLNGSGVVVDANFAGLWPVEPNALPSDALLALLNSSWTWANLESTCTVLGGGALKIEATDLQRLALPDLSASAVERLAELGRSLVKGSSDAVADSIDEVVTDSLRQGEYVDDPAAALRALAERALQHRSRDGSSVGGHP
ncbi:N-6 DNA methylase [Micrococcus sp. Mcc89]|uniref:N-6 DNA methylase n=1 Tax=Micrococcus sp. Mcc89 TaxID=2926014 RepID=UPI00211923B7|nr:N-6 DNA methylase [Micrococcus sp. Mcc89]